MTLVDMIVDYRTTHGLSQRQFALLCGVSNGYISMLEKNANPKTGLPVTPSLPVLKKIASGMGLTLSELMSNIDDMPIDLASSAFNEKHENRNIIRIAGRDGSYVVKSVTDEQLQAFKTMLDALPSVDDDLI